MKEIVKKSALFLLAAAASLNSLADSCLKVEDANGTATYFSLSDKPVITFTTDNLVLTTSKETIEYPITAYRSFSFVDETTGIRTVTSPGAVSVTIGNSVSAEGLEAGSSVTIVSLSGEVIGHATVDRNGRVDIPLNGRTGIFIFHSTSRTFKFIK
ncbi:MAG: T9SS C-terminal target domain-containing protein [Prevotellaceae bacterium]|nr:T9SS C-terminal target domain-containing protein [Prevotellaceae bacterium]